MKRWGAISTSLIGPFPSEEHACLVREWKNEEEVSDHHTWYVRAWEDFHSLGQDRIRAAGMAPGSTS